MNDNDEMMMTKPAAAAFFTPLPAPAGTASCFLPTTSAFQQQGGSLSSSSLSSSPLTSMMALTSLSREQLVEVVRAHNEQRPRCVGEAGLSNRGDPPQQQTEFFSFTSPRAPKKAKHSETTNSGGTAADDDLEGYLAKGKAEMGVVGANGGSTEEDDHDDLIIRPRTRPFNSHSTTTSSSRTSSWPKRGTSTTHSRSYRSMASTGSTAAELDCLVSVTTPPGLLRRMFSTGSGSNTTIATTMTTNTGTVVVTTTRRLARPRNPCAEQQQLEQQEPLWMMTEEE
jgi:hypothetical protein